MSTSEGQNPKTKRRHAQRKQSLIQSRSQLSLLNKLIRSLIKKTISP